MFLVVVDGCLGLGLRVPRWEANMIVVGSSRRMAGPWSLGPERGKLTLLLLVVVYGCLGLGLWVPSVAS